MTQRFPPWMVVVLVVQLLLAGLFFLFLYSETRAIGLGAAPSLDNIVAMAMPLAFVVIFGAAALALSRSGRASAASLLAIAPLPLCFILFALAGMFW